jgi:hypothetical protein
VGFILHCYQLTPSFTASSCYYYADHNYADHHTPSLYAPTCYRYDDFNIVVGVHTSANHHHIKLDRNLRWFNIRRLLHVDVDIYAYINGCSTNRSR